MSQRPKPKVGRPVLVGLAALQILAAPVLFFNKWRRWQRRHRAAEWDMNRWRCETSAPAGEGPHLVFVATGFAEARTAAQLAERLREQLPALQVSYAIQDFHAVEQGKALPADANVLPIPFDFQPPVRRWLQGAKPDAIVFIERFWYANLVLGAAAGGVKLAAVAGHTPGRRDKAAPWKLWYDRRQLEAFDAVCVRAQIELDRLGKLQAAPAKTVVTGSLKFLPRLPSIDPEKKRELHSWLAQTGQRPLLAVGSTQPGDELWILQAFQQLRSTTDAVLLLAPRNPVRADEVEKLILEAGWTVSRRSGAAAEGADVLLLDTLGELAHAYGAGLAAFVGGTITGQGHNVLEPLAHGIPVFFGPKGGVFAAEQAMAIEAGAGFRVNSPEELAEWWRKLVTEPKTHADLCEQARRFNENGETSWSVTATALAELFLA